MAVHNGKLYLSWVQRSRLCIPDATGKPALGHWPLAIGFWQNQHPSHVDPRSLAFIRGKFFLRDLPSERRPAMKRQPGTKSQAHTRNRADGKIKTQTTNQAYVPKGCLLFPQVNGKKVESVELWLDSNERVIIVWFQDRTCLHFDLVSDLSVNTDYFDWKSGEQRVIKRWPLVRRT